jgi:hypothetical protein
MADICSEKSSQICTHMESTLWTEIAVSSTLTFHRGVKLKQNILVASNSTVKKQFFNNSIMSNAWLADSTLAI